eukprot:6210074-Pleurochrysis_carterae.AAC.3
MSIEQLATRFWCRARLIDRSVSGRRHAAEMGKRLTTAGNRKKLSTRHAQKADKKMPATGS